MPKPCSGFDRLAQCRSPLAAITRARLARPPLSAGQSRLQQRRELVGHGVVEDGDHQQNCIVQLAGGLRLDCTTQQYELIRVIFHDGAAMPTVGADTKQRSMAWAGALEGTFERYAVTSTSFH